MTGVEGVICGCFVTASCAVGGGTMDFSFVRLRTTTTGFVIGMCKRPDMAALFLGRTRNAILCREFSAEATSHPPQSYMCNERQQKVCSPLSSVSHACVEPWLSFRMGVVLWRSQGTIFPALGERVDNRLRWSSASLFAPPLSLVMADQQCHIDLVLLVAYFTPSLPLISLESCHPGRTAGKKVEVRTAHDP